MPDGSMFPDQFIGAVISEGRLDLLVIDINHDTPDTHKRVEVYCTLTIEGQEYTFDGVGPTMGHALEDCLVSIHLRELTA